MAVKTATEQDTEMIIFGSGMDMYSWWGHMRDDFERDWKREAPNGWAWLVEYESPTEDEWIVKAVTHADVMRAVRKIANREIEGANETLVRECRNMVFNVDAADLDASDADCILQVAVLDGIFYG